MPRIRTIKPDFFTSDTVTSLPLRARLTWIGLWTHCDDYGRARDNVKLVKAAVWPLDDVSLRDVSDDLAALERAGVIYRYTGPDGKAYIQVTSWTEHQKVDRPSKSPIPAPEPGPRETPSAPQEPLDESSREAREPASSPRDRKGKEGKGKEGTRTHAREAPHPTCETHRDTTDPPPCGQCADGRKARARWDRDQAAAAGEQQSATARERAEATRLAIGACHLCDSEGYQGGRLCAHDPDVPDRSRRGAAAVRAALARHLKAV
jgi:hypothetical protein